MLAPRLLFLSLRRWGAGLVVNHREADPRAVDAVGAAAAGGRWTAEKAGDWAASQPWTLGCNYIPRTAVNTLEMWQAETFDPAVIDQELGWAEALGFNAVRVFTHHLLWQQDPGGFLRRLDRFLEIADRHHIGTMFVLFDDSWNRTFALGPQPAPRPGVHNSGWVQCPGPELLQSPERWGVLEDNTKGVIGFFRGDRRVLAWDLYNEPGNSNYFSKSLPLLRSVFAWARAAGPGQPLTVGSTTFRANRIAASQDPVALDYWASKNILCPINNNPRHHPDYPGVHSWLTIARDYINDRGGFDQADRGIQVHLVTNTESDMRLYETVP